MVITEDADLDLAVEGALFSGFGTAGQRCTSLGTVIVHESVHDEFVEPVRRGGRAARRWATRPQDVLFGPLLDEKFAAGFEKSLGWIGAHHTVHRRDRPGRRGQPARRLRRRPRGRAVLPPGDRRRRAAGRRAVPERDVRPDRRRHDVLRRSTRRSSSATSRATACPARSTPPTRTRRSGSRRASRPAWSASTTRRPAPRRTCRSAATASPATARGRAGIWVLDQFTRWQSHELGLLRQAAEGADGHRRRSRRDLDFLLP